MDFDDDSVALFLIGFLAVVFVGAAWQKGEVLTLANGIMEFGLGAIAGYMTRNKPDGANLKGEIKRLAEENKKLRQALHQRRNTYSEDEPL